MRAKGVEFRYIESKAKGEIDANGDEETFHRVAHRAEVEEEQLDQQYGYLIFFNEKNGRRVLKAPAISTIKKTLNDGYAYRWRCCIKAAQSNSQVFFEDDIRQQVKKGLFGGSKCYVEAVDNLLQELQEEE